MPSPEALLAEGKAVHQRFRGHPVEFITVEECHDCPPSRMIWFRMGGSTMPSDPALHRYLLAYSSDFNLLLTSLLAHDVEFGDPRLRIASLDHALWFHRPIDLSDWVLSDQSSPSGIAGRGLATSTMYNRAGQLVCVATQELYFGKGRG